MNLPMSEARGETRRVPVTCNRDCGGGCPLLAHVREGRVVRITDNPLAGPFLHGCPRGFQAHRQLYAPDRLRTPLLRTGPRGSGQFGEADWNEALDLVALRLREIVDREGPRAILALAGSGACRGALHNTGALTRRFFSLLGGYSGTYGSYSSGAANYVTPFVLGSEPAGTDAASLEWSQMVVLWGANVAECRMGCELPARVRQARERGVPVVVIDPRRSDTVREFSSEWIPVRPGTDSALMLAVLYVLVTEDLVDRVFVARTSVGFEDLERHVLGRDEAGIPRTPDWAEAICGTPAAAIADFAQRYGRVKPTALLPGLSIQRTIGGEEAMRLAITLQVATGNLGRLGGSSGALSWGRLPWPRAGAIGLPTPPEHAAVPVLRWPDLVLEGRSGGYPSDIAAIYTVGNNYVVQGSDLHKSVRAFEKVDFAVCHEMFLTDTARYCDVVLPATHFLEREDLIFPAENGLLFTHQVAEPLPGTRDDYAIFADLADRLGFGERFTEGRTPAEWLQHFLDKSEVPDHEALRRTGLYYAAEQNRVGLSAFAADPQAHPLSTPSGRVEIACPSLEQSGGSLLPQARVLSVEQAYPLRLITPTVRWRTHSQHENIPWFRARIKQALWIHPTDAAERGIDDGQAVWVSSPQGRVEVPAYVTPDILPGVVCLHAGAWPLVRADGVDVGGSPNVLTSTEPTLPSQGSRTHSVLVQVQAV
ncbi:MAG: molybdopterin-containing oxidoreductase family protein [Anaerolineae bacterium]